jgi:glutamate 5-kinase
VHRASVKAAARLVVKLGTGVITDSRRQPDPAQLEQLVAQIAALQKSGKEIVLVTSGAVGARSTTNAVHHFRLFQNRCLG